MIKYLQLKLSDLNQVQESNLLHLIELNLDFSLEQIKIFDQQQNKNYLLINVSEQQLFLTNILLDNQFQEISVIHKHRFFLKLLMLLTDNLLTLQSLMLKPNLQLIKPELIICYHQKFEIEKIKWLTLPENCMINQTGAGKNNQAINLWQCIAKKEPELKKASTTHYEFIKQAHYQEALYYLHNIYQKIEPETKNLNEQILPMKNSKPKANHSRNRFDKDRKKKNQLNIFSRIKQLFFTKRIRTVIPTETTVPLNPQDDLFRLAMISEGPPGTVAENEGLRAFILVNEFLIGRDKLICDLVLPEKSVGRLHARISRHGSHYFLEDLGSANGTTLDGKKLNKHQTQLLPDQCRLKFAERTFYFYVE